MNYKKLCVYNITCALYITHITLLLYTYFEYMYLPPTSYSNMVSAMGFNKRI